MILHFSSLCLVSQFAVRFSQMLQIIHLIHVQEILCSFVNLQSFILSSKAKTPLTALLQQDGVGLTKLS